MDVFQLVPVTRSRQAAWEQIASAPLARETGVPLAVTLTVGAWPDVDAEGYLEFRTAEKTSSRTAFIVREHLPGEHLRLQLLQGALSGAFLDVAIHEVTETESVVTGRISNLGSPQKRAKNARGKPMPTPRERRAVAALAAFLEATFAPAAARVGVAEPSN